MELSKAIKCCPEAIGEWINDIVLPTHADGYNTATYIARLITDEARERLELEKEDDYFYYLSLEDPLIDSWLSVKNHKKIVAEYIQAVFDSWEEAGEPNE